MQWHLFDVLLVAKSCSCFSLSAWPITSFFGQLCLYRVCFLNRAPGVKMKPTHSPKHKLERTDYFVPTPEILVPLAHLPLCLRHMGRNKAGGEHLKGHGGCRTDACGGQVALLWTVSLPTHSTSGHPLSGRAWLSPVARIAGEP